MPGAPWYRPAQPDQVRTGTTSTVSGTQSATTGNSMAGVPPQFITTPKPNDSYLPNAPSWWQGGTSTRNQALTSPYIQPIQLVGSRISPFSDSYLPNAPWWWAGGTTTNNLATYPAYADWFQGIPTSPTAPGAGAGGGGGGGYGSGGGAGSGQASLPPAVTWSKFNSGIPNAPDWWQAMKPSAITPTSEWMASMNMMIPFLSQEDQKTVAATLYQQDPKNFSYLKGIAEGTPTPSDITEQQREYFTSAGRAQNAMGALNKLASAMGKTSTDFGPGYQYLNTILQNMQNFGGGGNLYSQQTRRQQMNMMGALDPLLSQSSGTSGDLAAYGPLAKALAMPFFSGGQLLPMTKNSTTGQYQWGTPNLSLL